jgi:hypothetical protein
MQVGDEYIDSRDPRKRRWTVVISAARFRGVAVVYLTHRDEPRWVPLAVFREYYVPAATPPPTHPP